MRITSASQPVAVFDSGVGGLTVLHECLVSLGHEDWLYFGDTARFPYGTRATPELEAFSHELAERLLERGAKLLVVACNSATAAALPALYDSLAGRVGVVGVIEPEAAAAARATRTGRVGLLATPATVRSGAYARALHRHAPSATLYPVSCTDLAPLIQAGGEIDQRVVDAVEGYCAPLRAAAIDTVILGCTHYPLVGHVIQRALGRGVRLVSSGRAMAERVEAELAARGLENRADRRGSYRFLCSGDPDAFRRAGSRFLQMPLGDVTRVPVRVERGVESGARQAA